MPLAAGIFIAPAVALAREVDPLRMAELVAHEVQVAAVDRGRRREADHLVQGDAARDGAALVVLAEMPVHVRVDEAENDRLVADECLIVALAVRDGLFAGAAVRELPPDTGRMPVLIFFLLDRLDPEVRDVHGEAVVKAIAAILEWRSEPRHAADVLSDRDGLRIDLVDEAVREREVADGIVILMAVEIVAVSVEILAETVAVIQHGRHAIKAEAIEMVLFEPVFAVRKQEMQHVILAVIEAEAVPGRMEMAVARIEVLVRVAGEVAESLCLIAGSMAVDDIHDDGDAHIMRRIDEFFQLLRRTEARAGGKERADVIAEAAVVRVLLDGHDLDGIVAVLLDAGQDIVLELRVGADLLRIAAHADMAFVNEQRVAVRVEHAMMPMIMLFRIPHLCREDFRLLILHDALAPGRDALPRAARPVDLHLIQVAMLHRLGRQFQFPVSRIADFLTAVFLDLFPVVEIADEIDIQCMRRLLAEHPAALRAMQAIVLVPVREIGQMPGTARQLVHFPDRVVVPAADRVFVRLQPAIPGNQSNVFFLFHANPPNSILSLFPWFIWVKSSLCRSKELDNRVDSDVHEFRVAEWMIRPLHGHKLDDVILGKCPRILHGHRRVGRAVQDDHIVRLIEILVFAHIALGQILKKLLIDLHLAVEPDEYLFSFLDLRPVRL